MTTVAVEHEVVVAWQRVHAAPHRLTGQRMKRGGIKEMDGEPLPVERRPGGGGQHVGPIGGDPYAQNGSVKHPSKGGEVPCTRACPSTETVT